MTCQRTLSSIARVAILAIVADYTIAKLAIRGTRQTGISWEVVAWQAFYAYAIRTCNTVVAAWQALIVRKIGEERAGALHAVEWTRSKALRNATGSLGRKQEGSKTLLALGVVESKAGLAVGDEAVWFTLFVVSTVVALLAVSTLELVASYTVRISLWTWSALS